MTAPAAVLERVLRNVGTGTTLGTAHLLLRRHSPGQTSTPSASSRRRRLTSALAAVGPVATVGHAVVMQRGRWQLPRSGAGKALLVGHVVAGAWVEELLWRGPLVHLRPGPLRALAALGSGLAFVGVHVPRDGWRAVPVQTLNAASWTAATLTDGRVWRSVVSHAGYNLAALALRAPATSADRTAT